MLNTTTEEPIDINEIRMNWYFYRDTEHDLYTVEEGEIMPLTNFEADYDFSDPLSRIETEAYEQLYGCGYLDMDGNYFSQVCCSCYFYYLFDCLIYKHEIGQLIDSKSLLDMCRGFRDSLTESYSKTFLFNYKLSSVEFLISELVAYVGYFIMNEIKPNELLTHKHFKMYFQQYEEHFQHLGLSWINMEEKIQQLLTKNNSNPEETEEVFNIFNKMEKCIGIDSYYHKWLTDKEKHFVNHWPLRNQLNNELATKPEQPRKQTKI